MATFVGALRPMSQRGNLKYRRAVLCELGGTESQADKWPRSSGERTSKQHSRSLRVCQAFLIPTELVPCNVVHEKAGAVDRTL